MSAKEIERRLHDLDCVLDSIVYFVYSMLGGEKMNTRDLTVGERLFILMKGEPKTGKSVAAHSFPNTYTFAIDYRMESVKHFYPDRDFEYDHFDNLIQVNKRIEDLKLNCPWDTLIFDGITSYSNLAISCMIDHRAPSPGSKTVRAGIPVAEVEDYGGEARALTMMLDGLRAISIKHKKHVIVIAHVLNVENYNLKTNTTSVSRTLLTAGKKIAAAFPKDFNEVYHFDVQTNLETGEPEYIVYTKHQGVDFAGTALPLSTRINWTNKNFYQILLNQIKSGGLML